MTSGSEFGRLFSGTAARRDRVDADDLTFERSTLRFVAQRTGATAQATRALDRLWEQRTGDPRGARFVLFNELFTGFPFRISTSRLRGIPVPWGTTDAGYEVHADPYATEPARFKNFKSVPFVAAFLAAAVETVAGINTCLVFPRKGFARGLCIHDDNSEQYWTNGLCWVYKYDDGEREQRLYVQPFAALIDSVRKVWHWPTENY